MCRTAACHTTLCIIIDKSLTNLRTSCQVMSHQANSTPITPLTYVCRHVVGIPWHVQVTHSDPLIFMSSHIMTNYGIKPTQLRSQHHTCDCGSHILCRSLLLREPHDNNELSSPGLLELAHTPVCRANSPSVSAFCSLSLSPSLPLCTHTSEPRNICKASILYRTLPYPSYPPLPIIR